MTQRGGGAGVCTAYRAQLRHILACHYFEHGWQKRYGVARLAGLASAAVVTVRRTALHVVTVGRVFQSFMAIGCCLI